MLSAEVGGKHGFSVSGLVFDEIHAYELHTKAVDILEGRRVDPTFYPVVYGLKDDEDWEDEANWYKVNPSLGYTVDIERLRDAYREAKQNPADEVTFKWLRLNMWVSSTVAWIPDAIFMKGNEEIDLAALEGRDCYGGLDLSSTGDITALVLMFPPRDEDEKYILLPFFWVPEETIPQRVKAASVPYDIWERQGYLLSTEGNVIHYDFIEKFINDLAEKYHICEIAGLCFDVRTDEGLLSSAHGRADHSRRTSCSQVDGRKRGSRYGSSRKHQGNEGKIERKDRRYCCCNHGT